MTYSTFFNWQKRKQNGQLKDKSSRPDNSPRATKKKQLMQALETIFKHPDWGAKKISQYLTREKICYLSTSTLNRIKKELEKEINMDEIKVNQRYEFIKPNDCWSLDFMEFKWGNEKLYLSFILDDKSRYILNWSITGSATFEFVKELLEKTFKQYGQPEVIKSDNGSQFRKQFKAQLEEWLITHHPNPVYCPNYNGKTERKNRDFRDIVDRFNSDISLEEIFSTISSSIYEHNHVRPHQSLDGATPYQSYNGFADKVRAKMEAFKKREKKRKGFKTKDSIKNKNNNKGAIMPAYLVNEQDNIAGFVKSFIEFRL